LLVGTVDKVPVQVMPKVKPIHGEPAPFDTDLTTEFRQAIGELGCFYSFAERLELPDLMNKIVDAIQDSLFENGTVLRPDITREFFALTKENSTLRE
jgi:hypothetical protein